MSEQLDLYREIGNKQKNATESKLFGKPCFKINNKAFVCFFQDEMVFKLTGDFHAEALELEDSKLFDPSGKNRPMKEWVQVPYMHKQKWEKYAKEAMGYVGSL